MWVLVALALLALPTTWATTCGGIFSRQTGGLVDTIVSPGYADGSYPNGLSCKYKFTSDNYQVGFIIKCPSGQFDVTETNNCKSGDRLRVRDGLTISDDFCGTSGPNMMMSGGPFLWILFKTNNDGVSGRGFNCTVETVVDTTYTTASPPASVRIAAPIHTYAAKGAEFVPPQGYKCTCGEERTEMTRVLGGVESEYNTHPWVAGVFARGEPIPICSGVVIDNLHVLTAAKCTEMSDIQVRLGDQDLGQVSRTITRDVESFTIKDDLAILRYSSPINLGSQYPIQPICLPNASCEFTGATAKVTGWGSSFSGQMWSLSLQELELTVASTCEDSFVCVNDPGEGSGLCMLDSGSPLMVNFNGRNVLVGVAVSRDSGDDSLLFTDIQMKLDWIEDITDIPQRQTCRN